MWLGTEGSFYMTASDQGACSGTTPTYFRVDTSEDHRKEFYAMILYAAAQQKSLECVVASGCGTTHVWIEYCTMNL
jgi:hypothetical protein